MDLFDIPLPTFQFFFLIFIRIWGITFFSPIFSLSSFPRMAKTGFSFFVACLLFPVLSRTVSFSPPVTSLEYFYSVAWQLAIGFMIGFVIRTLFEGVQFCGEIIGFQMGFAIVNVIDPQGSAQIPLLALFQNILATLLFLAINAHHLILRLLVRSFTLLPFDGIEGVGTALQRPSEAIKAIVLISSEIFILAVKLAAPAMAVLIFINVGLAIVARTVPQINIFIVGFPIQIALGFFILSASLTFFTKVFIFYSSRVHTSAYNLLKVVAHM